MSNWKKVILCASLFASVSIALVRASRWMEPGVLPVLAAVGLGLIGVVLILLAPPAPEKLQPELQPEYENPNHRSNS